MHCCLSDDVASDASLDYELSAEYEDHHEYTSEPYEHEAFNKDKMEVSQQKRLEDLIFIQKIKSGKFSPEPEVYVHFSPKAIKYIHEEGPDGPGPEQYVHDSPKENPHAASYCKAVMDYYLENC